MEGSQFATPYTTISVSTLGVTRVCQRLSECTPLHGEVIVVVERCYLVDTPAERTVVEHYTCNVSLPSSVSTVVDIDFLTSTQRDKTHNSVCLWTYSEVTQCDTRIRSCLTSNSSVLTHCEVALQCYDSSNVKDYYLWVVARYRPAEGTLRVVIFKGGDVTYYCRFLVGTTSTSSIASVTFSTRECRYVLCLCSESY